MNKNKRDFKGIWIPKQIWLNEKLTLQEKVFFVEIDSLDNEEGCFATNDYFATFFKISKTRVSLVIKSLIKKGLIKSTLIREQGNKRILKRVINKAIRPSLTFIKDPLKQKLKDNNTLNNTSNKLINNNKQTSSYFHYNNFYKYVVSTNPDINFKQGYLQKNKVKADTVLKGILRVMPVPEFFNPFKREQTKLNKTHVMLYVYYLIGEDLKTDIKKKDYFEKYNFINKEFILEYYNQAIEHYQYHQSIMPPKDLNIKNMEWEKEIAKDNIK